MLSCSSCCVNLSINFNTDLWLFFTLQSHIDESEGEMKLVEKMFPMHQSYAELYDKNNLLTNKVQYF